MKNLKNATHGRTVPLTHSFGAGYMTAKDVYLYFDKRVSLDRCIELLHKGLIRSARIGGKLLTKREYVQEFEEEIFYRTAPPPPSLLSTLVVSHKGIETITANTPSRSTNRPLKPR